MNKKKSLRMKVPDFLCLKLAVVKSHKGLLAAFAGHERVTTATIFILIILILSICGIARAETGTASYFSNVETNGRSCADGRYHNLNTEFVVASWIHPLGTVLRISRVDDSSVYVDAIVADRGPGREDGTSRYYKGKRIADLSVAAFSKLAPLSAGLIKVSIERID